METSKLTGAALDWAVAKCEGKIYGVRGTRYEFQPSTHWSQGGPIIERERIGVWPSASIEGVWAARPDCEVHPNRLPPTHGDTPLIAAMRCYVASKLGDTVEMPEELN